MIAYIISFVSLVLELLLSKYIALFNGSNTILIPMFTITSLIITLSFFSNKKNEYLFYSLILGLIYDIAITSTFPLNTVIFGIISYLLLFIDKNFSYNLISNSIKLIIIVFLYDTITYSFLSIIDYINYNIMTLLLKFLRSIVLNYLYLIFLYNITNFIFKKLKVKRSI